jgi:hypothetical protein
MVNIKKALRSFFSCSDINRNMPETTEPYFRGPLDEILYEGLERIKMAKDRDFIDLLIDILLCTCFFLFGIAFCLVVTAP